VGKRSRERRRRESEGERERAPRSLSPRPGGQRRRASLWKIGRWRPGDGAASLLHEEDNIGFEKIPLGFGVFQETLKQHYLQALFLVLQPFDISKLFREVGKNKWHS
jgi:hypothetical protein